MKYVGSKNRLAKYIAPIIQDCIDKNGITEYYEPFVGGANMIDKIHCKNRIGSDIHPYLIATLKAQSAGWLPKEDITEEKYNDIKNNKDKYPDELVGYAGFQLSYGGKWFGGYRRDKEGKRNYSAEAYKNTAAQLDGLKGVVFEQRDFRELDTAKISGAMIYCDIPYKGTTKYSTGEFPYDEFFEWARALSKNNYVLISEYSVPDDFEVIWEKKYVTLLDSNKSAGDKGNERVERLFSYTEGLYSKQKGV